jgi:hypothetical protein
MKDRELRKLLKKYGIINAHSDGRLMDVDPYPSFKDVSKHYLGCYDQKCEDVESLKGACARLLNGFTESEARIWDLEDKLDAINEHYGIEVEKQDARYVVKEQ